ncbi:MAG TPA: alpha/beta hydrolase [Gemmataceae bacterium]|nr:alpha/beta hydrolase [Gemmataceae bacterium]
MFLFWLGFGILCSAPMGVALVFLVRYWELRIRYMDILVRIFQEKPLFIVPRGQPVPEAEDVRFPAADGATLAGCYLRAAGPRRGVILFGLEFGSNRWSCQPYCEHLLAAGYDVFAFETRGQGDSDCPPGYEPLQWVTQFEVNDAQAALTYLKNRPDADPCGVGFFGVSKGAGAGLLAAARDPYVRCFVTDGVFGVYTTLVPYMRQWFRIYNNRLLIQGLVPSWYYGLIGLAGLAKIERLRGCRFPHLEDALPRLAPRPLLMIHGGGDTYIKPEMARALCGCAREPRELWVVEGAKHNMALQTAGDEYRRRVLDFFNNHLAQDSLTQRRKDRKEDKASVRREPAARRKHASPAG